ncbi:hypothetical protein POSPLADRAFT_1064812 [Postia placenta MAD-698-R-SB12]|uniref:TECPR1-like DysF domain-containing protein n=1 Tax=Postia placenta MAD-698-R-SB12 TaxID=670580 RepID=A0A1X6NDB1_9APHY|nr:hypothetical protein POSPLADRAFT_1064812 [Postia placenta MAD-698-R-SB12]OSX66618.1 hypothetical protein POSPLADRAFT_1064812 [Postia placenta MAD-698-R-SB12]
MPTAAETTTPPPLADFLNTLPSPLTTALVGLGPCISRTRRVAQVLSWKASWEESWLALAVWWAACLCVDAGLRYLLPTIIVASIAVVRWRYPAPSTAALVTEDTLQQTISDLSTLLALLPPLPPVHDAPPLFILMRVSAIMYVPYLILTYFVRLRIILALAGTLIFTWRARWAALIRRALWRSAHIRWATYRAWSALSGLPLPARALTRVSASSGATATHDLPTPANELRFLFSVYENQRWWMGLDWTAALLPGERPAWCVPNLSPASPPAGFALPAPTTVYLPAPEGRGRVKRTARWRWAEPEWRVAVHREGEAASRVERPLPREDAAGVGGSASRVLKAAGKMREGSISIGGGGSPERHAREREVKEGEEGEEDDAEMFTDADGWMYADNKWEGASAKGGMGKYTRFRRWTRIAMLSETVELVGPGEVGIQKDGEKLPSDPTSPTNAVSPVKVEVPPDWQPAQGRPDGLDKVPKGTGEATAQGEEDGLKRRLKAVVQNATS